MISNSRSRMLLTLVSSGWGIPLFKWKLVWNYDIPVNLFFVPVSLTLTFFRRNHMTMSKDDINKVLDQVQFFNKELPIFAKTGIYLAFINGIVCLFGLGLFKFLSNIMWTNLSLQDLMNNSFMFKNCKKFV